ncbi:MAG: hypothetical protein ACTSU9_07130 [Promethearchaeota archaeon]
MDPIVEGGHWYVDRVGDIPNNCKLYISRDTRTQEQIKEGIQGKQYLQFIEDYYHAKTDKSGYRYLDISDQIIWLGKFLSENGIGIRNKIQIMEITGGQI